MAYSLVNSASATGENGGSTSSIDTTGVDLLILVVNEYVGGPHAGVSDSKSNTWVELTTQEGSNTQSTIYYCKSPTVGSGHTFTASGTASYIAVQVLAFSGADLTDPFDQQNGANTLIYGTTTSWQPGSITPSEDDELVISAICVDAADGGMSVGSSFTLQESDPYAFAVNMGGYTAYKIQTAAGAENPTWSWSNATNAASVIASFKAAAGAGSSVITPYYYENLLQGAGI